MSYQGGTIVVTAANGSMKLYKDIILYTLLLMHPAALMSDCVANVLYENENANSDGLNKVFRCKCQ